jgi:hypothetical protein
MGVSLRFWLRIAFINLLVVVFIGVVLRYKIAFSFPFIDQKNLLHGHSHFAFTGWITQALMALLAARLNPGEPGKILKKYRWLLFANLFTAYGMLVSFPLQGYGAWSISFSTLSILTAYAFAFFFWKDLDAQQVKSCSHRWYKAALLFNIISSAGTFFLAYMMATKNIHQHWYLASVYFFLHFQYNGWFFFAGMGLLIGSIEKLVADKTKFNLIFRFFVLACVPAYFLSALWLPTPAFVYWLVVLAAAAQLAGWGLLVQVLHKNKAAVKGAVTATGNRVLLLAGAALSIKLLLQMGSVIPSLSHLAFGFRPIVIGYLHLVLLGVITMFLLGYTAAFSLLAVNKNARAGISIFVAGIIINECLLMTQGVAALSYTGIPFINEMLLVAALIMLGGMVLFVAAFKKKGSTNCSSLPRH